MVLATVREWHDALGWGVLDSPETPDGCWAHFSVIDTPVLHRSDGHVVSEYKTLSIGETVDLTWESPGQDGFDYRAVSVTRR